MRLDIFNKDEQLVLQLHIFLKVTFQAVLSTNGNVSFCGMIYRNISKIVDFPRQHQIGFDAGDRQRGVNLNKETLLMSELEGANVFRIDGN